MQMLILRCHKYPRCFILYVSAKQDLWIHQGSFSLFKTLLLFKKDKNINKIQEYHKANIQAALSKSNLISKK